MARLYAVATQYGTFETLIRPGYDYETVRGRLRRFIRSNYSPDARLGRDGSVSELGHYNPSIKAYGYKIISYAPEL